MGDFFLLGTVRHISRHFNLLNMESLLFLVLLGKFRTKEV